MSELFLFNTLGRQLQAFEPLNSESVRLYTCGPTVYNTAHIGNLRSFLFEDILRRSLKYLGYQVQQVMNLTDIDDRTIDGAHEAGVSLEEFTAPFIEAFFRDLDILHLERAEEYPRATDHVPEMIEIIRRLEEKGYAYPSDGSVFFRISEDEDYGRLSGLDLDQMRMGERVATDDYDKEDVRDFVLWKGAKPGEPSWESPWGPGRPGWHIECSAMSEKYLGKTFDIHCGGVDNIFPHHENEIAQSESANEETFVNYWVHSEHLIVNGEKMSKSLGNFYTLADLLEQGRSARSIRYLFLSVNYRQKLNFTFESLDASEAALRRVDEMQFRLDHAVESEQESPKIGAAAAALAASFRQALEDDLNLSQALSKVFQFIKTVNLTIETRKLGLGDRQKIKEVLADVDRVLGVLDASAWETAEVSGPDDEAIDALVQARVAARAAKDWGKADELRAKLTELEIIVEDTPQGPRWRRK